MPRFSAKAKEAMDLIFYYTDFEKANKVLGELQEPLGIAIAEMGIVFYHLQLQQFDKMMELLIKVEKDNEDLNDEIISLLINIFHCTYNLGLNHPLVSREKAGLYHDRMVQTFESMNFEDDWERYYCAGNYFGVRSIYEAYINNDLSKAIEYQVISVEEFSKIPGEGSFYEGQGQNNLGALYMILGDFVNAEKLFTISYNVNKKYNNLMKMSNLSNLSKLNFQKGNLDKARELNEQGIKLAKKFNNIFWISNSLTTKASYLFQEGSYDHALEAYEMSLEYRKKSKQSRYIFWGHYHIFDYYYRRYKISRDREYLSRADELLSVLQEFAKINANDKTQQNYANYAQALIYKFGGIRKKGKSIEILEQLLEIYHTDIIMALELLELLFEDELLAEDRDSIDQIDALMERIGKIPLRDNPQAIIKFISQQIILAKYTYYIKGDPSAALEMLYGAKDKVGKYRLENLVNEVDAEIDVLLRDQSKWDQLDISVKERIRSSEFDKYIKQALKLKDSFT